MILTMLWIGGSFCIGDKAEISGAKTLAFASFMCGSAIKFWKEEALMKWEGKVW